MVVCYCQGLPTLDTIVQFCHPWAIVPNLGHRFRLSQLWTILWRFANDVQCCQVLPTLDSIVKFCMIVKFCKLWMMLSRFATSGHHWKGFRCFANLYKSWHVWPTLKKNIQFSQPWKITSGFANSGLAVTGPTGHTGSRSRWTQVNQKWTLHPFNPAGCFVFDIYGEWLNRFYNTTCILYRQQVKPSVKQKVPKHSEQNSTHL